MKRYPVILGIMLLSMAFVGQMQQPEGKIVAYGPNEILQYRLHYGFVNAGEATIMVHPALYNVNNKICYKATVSGKSTGSFAMVMTIKDEWGTYIDTATYIPQKGYRDITENNYLLKETVLFDFPTNTAKVIQEKGKNREREDHQYTITNNVQDIVSGAYYLRTLDYNKMAPNSTITLKAFFEDKLYDFTVKYVGKERIATKYGHINAIKIQPVMPDNELFDGGNSIRMWMSDDGNKIPLRIEADMFVGKVAIDLKAYSGLKYPISFSK